MAVEGTLPVNVAAEFEDKKTAIPLCLPGIFDVDYKGHPPGDWVRDSGLIWINVQFRVSCLVVSGNSI